MNITVTYPNVRAWLASLDEVTKQEIEHFVTGAKRHSPDAPRRVTFAFAGRQRVQLTEINCPFCATTLVANDVTAEGGRTQVICRECHHTILKVEPPHHNTFDEGMPF